MAAANAPRHPLRQFLATHSHLIKLEKNLFKFPKLPCFLPHILVSPGRSSTSATPKLPSAAHKFPSINATIYECRATFHCVATICCEGGGARLNYHKHLIDNLGISADSLSGDKDQGKLAKIGTRKEERKRQRMEKEWYYRPVPSPLRLRLVRSRWKLVRLPLQHCCCFSLGRGGGSSSH